MTEGPSVPARLWSQATRVKRWGESAQALCPMPDFQALSSYIIFHLPHPAPPPPTQPQRGTKPQPRASFSPSRLLARLCDVIELRRTADVFLARG